MTARARHAELRARATHGLLACALAAAAAAALGAACTPAPPRRSTLGDLCAVSVSAASPEGTLAESISPISRVPAEYPPEARKRGTTGWVCLAVTVDPDGSVSRVKVVDANPPGVFGRTAVRAVSKWRYPERPKSGIVAVYLAFREDPRTGIP